jgi:hypothetical protein
MRIVIILLQSTAKPLARAWPIDFGPPELAFANWLLAVTRQ